MKRTMIMYALAAALLLSTSLLGTSTKATASAIATPKSTAVMISTVRAKMAFWCGVIALNAYCDDSENSCVLGTGATTSCGEQPIMCGPRNCCCTTYGPWENGAEEEGGKKKDGKRKKRIVASSPTNDLMFAILITQDSGVFKAGDIITCPSAKIAYGKLSLSERVSLQRNDEMLTFEVPKAEVENLKYQTVVIVNYQLLDAETATMVQSQGLNEGDVIAVTLGHKLALGAKLTPAQSFALNGEQHRLFSPVAQMTAIMR